MHARIYDLTGNLFSIHKATHVARPLSSCQIGVLAECI
jgi:hypothetical protein